MRIADSDSRAVLTPQHEVEGVSNYYSGSRSIEGVRHYDGVRVREVRPGVDMLYHGDGQDLEYDFVLRPGADPNAIRMLFTATVKPEVDGTGDIVFKMPSGELRQRRPKVWQEEAGARHDIECRYVLGKDGSVRLALEQFRRTEALIIDPVLSYSTFLGGSGQDTPSGIAADSSGYAYVTGSTASPNFPVTSGVLATQYATEAFITKLNPSGTGLIYSTFIGGSGGSAAAGVAVAAGNAYITGSSSSADFPVTIGTTRTGAFIVKLNSAGTIVYSTVLSGATGSAIAVDAAGAAYVTGNTSSTGFPATPGSFRRALAGGQDAFVAKLAPTGQIAYATFLGGSNSESGNAIAVDASGNAFVGGATSSSDFPVTTGVFQTTLKGPTNGFVAELNAAGSALVYATYIGGSSNDIVNGLALDGADECFIAGSAQSIDFPTTPNAFIPSKPGANTYYTTGFAAKLNATGGALVYSTYLGASTYSLGDSAVGIAVDLNGAAYVVGSTSASNFPTVPGALKTYLTSNGYDQDIYMLVLSTDGGSLSYSTLLGSTGVDTAKSVALDGNGGVYIAGQTSSMNFPVTPGALIAANPKTATSSYPVTGIVSKIDMSSPVMCVPTISPSGATIAGRGGPFSFNLTLSPGCPWEAIANTTYPAVVTFTSATHGMGSLSPITISGTVPLNNSTSQGLNSTIQVGPASFNITQTVGECQDPVVAPSSYTFDSSGGIRSITVSIPSSCSWTAIPAAAWLVVTATNPASGKGSGSVTVYVAQNSFTQRSTTLNLAGKTVTITQTGSTCTSSASATVSSFNAQGGTGTASILPSSNSCDWTAYSSVPWIQLASSAASGAGAGSVPFVVSSNPGALGRSGQILIGDQVITIAQAAGPAGTVVSYNKTLFAGSGAAAGSVAQFGDGGPAILAVLNSPAGLAFDGVGGNLYIADTNDSRIRVVTPDGNINTFAGGGTSTADGVAPLSAVLSTPTVAALDGSGSLYISDLSARIRKISMGAIATFAGGTVYGSTGDNGPATSALLYNPLSVAADSNGNIYIADSNNSRVRKVSGGIITTFAGGGTGGLGDNGPATSATLGSPAGLAFDASGNLYISDRNSYRVRKVNMQPGPAQGTITTVAGGGTGADGGPATSASLYQPMAIAFDPAGNMLFMEPYRLRKVGLDGTISTIASLSCCGASGAGLTTDATGNIYFSDSYGNAVWKLAPVSSACAYSIGSVPAQPAASGSITVSITTTAGCAWDASSNLPWATIAPGTSGTGSGTFTVTLAHNAGLTARTASIAAAGQNFSITQNGSDPSVFVTQLYLDLLNRNPDSGGLTSWTNTIKSGSMSQAQVAALFFQSPEFAQAGLAIIKDYIAVLGRDPDYGGWLYWFTYVNGGVPVNTVLSDFIGSPEFNNTYGSLNNAQFVSLVYQNVLKRAPDSGGLTYWTGLLNAGKLDRTGIMAAFIASPEFSNGVSARAYANLLYMGFLRRTPDSSGLQYWTTFLTQPNSLSTAIAAFITSPEYLARFQ